MGCALLPPTNKVCEGYVFTGVCLYTREVSAPLSYWDTQPGQTPSWADTPWVDTPWADIAPRRRPPGRHPPADTPGQTHTRADTPYLLPLSSACWKIWSTSRRYAFNWNAFFIIISLCFYLQRRDGHGYEQTCQCKFSQDGVKLQIFEEQGFFPADVNYHCCTCVETRCNCGNGFADIPGQNYRVRDCFPCGCSCSNHYNQQTRNF